MLSHHLSKRHIFLEAPCTLHIINSLLSSRLSNRLNNFLLKPNTFFLWLLQVYIINRLDALVTSPCKALSSVSVPSSLTCTTPLCSVKMLDTPLTGARTRKPVSVHTKKKKSILITARNKLDTPNEKFDKEP